MSGTTILKLQTNIHLSYFHRLIQESSEILENLEYVSIQITLLRNECIVTKELNN